MRAAAARSLAVLALVLPFAACGQSDEDKAQQAVCDARDDIAQQVDELKGMSASTVTADAVRGNIDAIRNDLKDIGDARGDLSADRRKQIEDANQAFTAQVQSVAGDVLRSISASDAKAQLTSAAQQLADSYQQSFAKISCD